MEKDIEKTTELIKEQSSLLQSLRQEVSRVLVGQEQLFDRMLTALISGGHILLEGVPGLAKTTAVKTMAEALGIQFQRISFTPDLLPADVVGTMIYHPGNAEFTPRKGPVFTNVLLADEINRAPAKVQSALLESMQECQVTLGDQSYMLPTPFMVMATQNPIEQEGTYTLPEAQVDRFMLKCKIDYPTRHDERLIMRRFSTNADIKINPVISRDQILELQSLLDHVYCDERIADYILDIIFATRNPQKLAQPVAHLIEYGASPRGSLCLHKAARANALLNGRAYTTPQDVKDVAHDVLRHRIIRTYEAEAEACTTDDILESLLKTLPVP